MEWVYNLSKRLLTPSIKEPCNLFDATIKVGDTSYSLLDTSTSLKDIIICTRSTIWFRSNYIIKEKNGVYAVYSNTVMVYPEVDASELELRYAMKQMDRMVKSCPDKLIKTTNCKGYNFTRERLIELSSYLFTQLSKK